MMGGPDKSKLFGPDIIKCNRLASIVFQKYLSKKSKKFVVYMRLKRVKAIH